MWQMPFVCFNAFFCVYFSILFVFSTYFIFHVQFHSLNLKMARSKMTAICLKFQYGFLCAGVSEVSWMGVWFFFWVNIKWLAFKHLKLRLISLHFGSKFEIVSLDWRDWFWFVIHCAIGLLMQRTSIFIWCEHLRALRSWAMYWLVGRCAMQ